MAHYVLVVDNNQAFATILKEGLETTGRYTVALADNGADALETVVETPLDMVIVDLGLTDVKPVRLVRAIREAKPSMRLLLIPLFGGQIPEDLGEVPIQGILPKPFFMEDLPRIVDAAMGISSPSRVESDTVPEVRDAISHADETPSYTPAVERFSPIDPPPVAKEPLPVEKIPLPSAPSPEVLSRLLAKEKQIVQILKALNHEVRAECILVTSGSQLIAFSGLMGREQTASLASLVAETTAAASRSAAFLGEPSGHFEQSLHEGGEYCLYSLSVSDDLVLSLALSTDVPLGTLRYRARQTAEELLDLVS